jgi:hypothetical protein
MNNRLSRISEDLERYRAKKKEDERKIKFLEGKYIDVENSEIQAMVRSANLSLDDLQKLIEANRKGKNPVIDRVLDDDTKEEKDYE